MAMKKNVFYFVLFFLITLAGGFIFYIYYQEAYVKLQTDLISISLNNEYWTAEDVEVTVDYQNKDIKIKNYSFDGGKTWQEENKFVATENQVLEIMLKAENGKKSKVVSYRIENIDKESPTIEVQDVIYVAKGTDFSFSNKYKVADATSGIRGKVQIKPSVVDTSELGAIPVQITVVDKAMNTSSKKFVIEVLNPNDPHLKEVNENGTISVTGLSLSSTRTSLVKGTSVKVEAIVKPAKATNKKVIWKTSNESVATVDESGTITGVNSGSATITATTEDGEKSSDIRVTVTNQKIEVTKIELDRTSDTVTTSYGTITLTATVSPENATDPSVRWNSTKPNVAIVVDGVVRVRGEGTTTITATTSNGKVATYILTVVDNYTFQIKEVRMETGELMGYSVKVYQNGVDITKNVTSITDPFTARNDKRQDEIAITTSNYSLIKDKISFQYKTKMYTASK